MVTLYFFQRPLRSSRVAIISPFLQPKQSDIMADCGYAEDCYLLKYLLPFTQAYRKAAKNSMFACSGESVQKVVIPELEELPEIGFSEDEHYGDYGEFTSEEEIDDEDENAIEDGDEEELSEEEEEEANSTRYANGLTIS